MGWLSGSDSTDTRALEALEAIKLVREHTQWGLQQSKDYVDGL